MVRVLILGLVLLTTLGGCASPDGGSVSQNVRPVANRSWSSHWASAYGKMDRAADGIGRILYPPLFVVAFPLWALSGFGASGK